MHDLNAFQAAMAALGVNARIEVTDAQRDLYWTMLADLSDEDFQRAVTLSLNGQRFFPTIAELREYVTPHVDHEATAIVAFEQVVKTGRHDARRGTTWSIRRVAEMVGPVAAEAYTAAGASGAFERELGERDLPYLRKRFVDSYVAAAEAQAKGRPLALAHTPHRLPRENPMQQLVAKTAQSMTLPTPGE